jgi:hypothetical protein
MKRILILVVVLLGVGQIVAQDANTAWKKVLKNCAKSDLIGKRSLFFGVSNTIGPGSVWRRADDNSIRLMFELSDAFPAAADQAKIVKTNDTVGCYGSSSSKWDIKLGLPFSTGATALTLNIGALLGQAKSVTVSVTGFAIDDLVETNWKQAFAGLPADNAYYKEIQQTGRLVAENAVKVTGLKAVFNYKTDISADVQAQFKGKAFTLGNSSSKPGNASGSATGTPTANGASTTTTTTTPSGTSGTGGSSNSGASSCSPSATNSSTDSTGTGSNTSGTGAPGTGSATLHVDFTNSRQLTICADGPFYLMAAYSQLLNGTPLGIAPTASTITLTPTDVPAKAVAGSDRH